ncbi:VTT domain-containing protein [Actinomycetes bacterium KLBMP 9797]
MTEILGWIGELPAGVVMLALGIVMVFDAIPLVGVLVPGDVMVLAAVGARGPMGGGGVLFGVVAGCVAGWSLTFLAGRHLGDRIRHGRVGTWIGEDRWAMAERALRRNGAGMVVAAPFLPVLNALMPLAAGGLRMPYRIFARNATLGATLWAGMYVLLGLIGQALGGAFAEPTVTMAATITIGLGIGWIVLFGARRRLTALA